MHRDLIEELYRKHHSSAFAYVFSLCGNKEIAEDVVSQAFEKAIITIDDSVPNFRYWLLRVCRNLWIDLKRREKKIAGTPVDELSIEANDDVPKDVMRKMENAELYEAIEDLDGPEKEIIVLFYFSNASIKEISMLTGISITNTKVKLHRTRLKLKKKMEDQK